MMLKTLWGAVGAQFTGLPVVKVMAGVIAVLCLALAALWLLWSNASDRAVAAETRLQSVRLALEEERRKRGSLAGAVIEKTQELQRQRERARQIQSNLIARLQSEKQISAQAMAEADALREAERIKAKSEGREIDEPLFDIRGIR